MNRSDDGPVLSLAQFDDQWKKTTTTTQDDIYSDIPDGTYQAVIEEARLTEATTGRPMVIWRMRIQGPQALNRVVTQTRVITENTLAYLKEDLEKCRINVTRLSELPERLKDLADRPVAFEKRTKDGRCNFYFRWQATRAAEIDINDLPF